jgi:two-component system sensor histidine kinase VicK
MNPESKVENLDQKVWIVNGAVNILNFYISRTTLLKRSVVCCYDYNGPIRIRKTQPIWRNNLKVDKRGIKVRFLTDIRNENLDYCKQMIDEIKHIEMRHMDGVKGNFAIHDDREYFLPFFVDKPGEPVRDALFCTQKEMVKAHLFIFENLWRQSTPANLRIRELEEGIHPEVLQPLSDPDEIVDTGYRLVQSAKYEILIIFHTANALLRQEKAGGVDLLVEKTIKYKTRVKILVPIEDKIKKTIQRLEQIDGIVIRNIEATMQTRMTILVVDKTYSLVVELKDDAKDNLQEAIGLATYSNSKSTVFSYVSIFDTLWKQSELREELLNLSMAQKEFINIAAHELRNPIQPILGLSVVLLHSDRFFDHDKNNEIKQKEILEIIARNAKRLQRLTEDILDVTRIDSKSLKPNKKSFVLAETIREMVQDYSSEIRKNDKNVILSFSSSEELVSTSIIADENRIKQVISNLIDNAIKFTQKGEITISIEIDYKHNQIVVKVKDTGKGIDSYILPKLFNKFVTKSDSIGTGLGLYICKGIIEAHHGMIWAENNSEGNLSMDVDRVASEMGSGATFSFSLPLDYYQANGHGHL